MVEVAIDVVLAGISNVCKVADHAVFVQFLGSDRDRRFHGMSMQVTALSAVVHEAVSVTEIKFFCDCVHSTAYNSLDLVRQCVGQTFSPFFDQITTSPECKSGLPAR